MLVLLQLLLLLIMLMVLLLILPLNYIQRDQHVLCVPVMTAPTEECNMYLEATTTKTNAKGNVVMLKFVVDTIWQNLLTYSFVVPPRRAIERP